MVRDKVRIRFRKGGDLRLVSHHDLMRCFERMLRRAALPFHSTSGFNPKPRLVFALSLALGIVGAEEVAELELDDEVPPDEVCRRLREQAPAGLDILRVERIGVRAHAQVRRACYRVAVPEARTAELAGRCAAVLAGSHSPVQRTRPEPRLVDVRPYIRGLNVGRDTLEMDLWVTPTGAARPDEVLGLLGLGDLVDAGAVIERTTLELHDECPAPAAGEPGSAPALPAPGGAAGARLYPLTDAAALPMPGTQPQGDA
jgi:radical SAM-linked protein